MKQINLTNINLVAIVDEDYHFILSYNSWNLSKGYPRAAKQINKIRKTVRMHQLIIERMGIVVSDGMVCDHINRNKLDNRRCNLRLATISQNAANADIAILNDSRNSCRGKPPVVALIRGVGILGTTPT